MSKAIRITVNSKFDLIMYAEINNKKYFAVNNKIEIDDLNEFPKQFLVYANIKEKKKLDYSFYIHKEHSFGLFQQSKKINAVEQVFVLNEKINTNILLLTLEIDYTSFQNYYDIEECYLTVNCNERKNVLIKKYFSKEYNIAKVIDFIFLLIKNLIWIFWGFIICYDAYKTRFSAPAADSLFYGDLIWIDILIIACVIISYTVFSFIRFAKHQHKTDKILNST